MSTHSKYSPSKSKRWINCPASISLSEHCPPQPTSKYAAEGTAAHKLGEYCLINETFPEQYKGRSIDGFLVDDEMVAAIELYLDTIYDEIDKSKGEVETGVECYINMDHIHPDLGGTCDFSLSTKRKLTMVDYKHGKGVDVDAEENSQGLNYLLGYATGLERRYTEYEFVIVQPRLDNPERHVKRWSCKHKDIVKFQKLVLDSIQNAESDSPRLAAGDWCHFCPASGSCPALHNKALTAASADFTPVSEEIDFTAPRDLTTDQLLLILDNHSMISSWLKNVYTHAFNLLKQSKEVGDYKLVRGRSNRKWVDEDDTIGELLELGYDEDDFMNNTPTLKSPAQVEKIVDDKKEITDLWFKPEGRLTIVPGDDKRLGVSPSAASDFDVIENDEDLD